MNEKLLKTSDYGDRENQAVLQVLVELAQILGSQHKNFVLVGGSVPSLLFKNATPPALLVMKGYALVGRDKQKDAYDICL
ncbi:MAG: hypothetical protein KZQ83_01610 [gamma proteobacterium symbiont of Taylorina sp.]|nr:hypothetical protein [gamma proteobacterium symbiont of Taylorina sp.]